MLYDERNPAFRFIIHADGLNLNAFDWGAARYAAAAKLRRELDAVAREWFWERGLICLFTLTHPATSMSTVTHAVGKGCTARR